MRANFSLVQYRTPEDPTLRLGIESSDVVHAPPLELQGQSTMDLLDKWQESTRVLRAIDIAKLDTIPEAILGTPLTFPRKVYCAGANYYSHAAEMKTERPNPANEPFFFLKTPTTTVIGPNDDICLDPNAGLNLDWEVELGVVIGTRCKNVSPEDAMDQVAGYLVANDISARGTFARQDSVFAAFAFDWVLAKNRDGSCPLGPGIVPAWQVADPHNLSIRLDVNGTSKQDSNTSDMVVRIPELIAAASRISTLEPGDVILTGTPAGVGAPRQDFLNIGDVVTASIQGLGSLSNTIVEELALNAVGAQSASVQPA